MQHGGLSTQSALEGIAPPPEIAQVVVELPLETPLDYRIPPDLRTGCCIGQRVLVPLGKRQVLGYIVGLARTSTVVDLKELVEILDETPLLTPALLQLTRWIAEYYLCPWGQVLKAAVPEGFRVQTEAVYTLTAQAQDNPETWPQGRAGEVLQCLAHHGTQGQHELERLLEVQDLAPWLRRLEQQGLVLRQQQRLAPKTQPRLVTVVRLRLSSADSGDLATAAATALPKPGSRPGPFARAASMGTRSAPAALPWSPGGSEASCQPRCCRRHPGRENAGGRTIGVHVCLLAPYLEPGATACPVAD